MTDTLMQHGQHGAEVLAGLMHGVFNPLVESIFEYGGKIVSFAGDGIMALYPVAEDERGTALRALASAWVVQQQLMENPVRRTIYGNFNFSAKIGLTLGSVSWKILQSKDGENATYYFRGSAVDDVAKAEHQAKSGEIILTQEIKDVLEDDVRTRPNEETFHRFIRFRVEMPNKTTSDFPPVDLNISRVFMPKEVIVEGVRGEFRQIVNLFIRIPDLPDEELKEFVNVIFELKKKYGGLVTRLDFGDKGCNMLLLWGAPLAFENDIGRTLNFILDLRSKVNVPITAGVTYYIAHAGYLGSALCEDYTCYGWGVNLAARFMMNAPDGEIWVDDRITQRVSQRFAMEYLGSQRFKGFAAEQKVHVLRYRKMESDVIYQGEMVGREDELRRMGKFVEPLWQGRFAGVLSVSGDAGIGKGRLVHECGSYKVFNEHDVYWAKCKGDQVLRQSFNPIRVWLMLYFGIKPDQNGDEQKSAFDSKLDNLLASVSDPELGRELDRTRSFLGALLDLAWDDSLYSQLDAEARYNNTLLALIALLKAESLRQPVILFVDDIQFIDSDSAVLLAHLKRSLVVDTHTYPLAIIVSYRREGSTRLELEELIDFEIKLDGIPHTAMTELIEEILGGKVSRELKIQIMVRSEGNPYFAEQVVRYLQEDGQLELHNGEWIRAERGRGSVLPSDIRALLVARLDKLIREVKSAVQTASVLGREFNLGVLSQMLGSEATTRNHVIEAEKSAIWSPLNEVRYIFHHGLLRDAAYSMQMRARRQELHVLALNALEILYEDAPERHYAELAYHAEEGEIRFKARRYYTKAGRVSADLYRNSEAVEYFTKALAFTDSDDLETKFDLLAERVELYSRMGKRELQARDMDILEEWVEQINDNDRRAKVTMLRSAYFYFIGSYQESIEYAEKAGNTSAALANTEQGIYTRHVWSSALHRLGRYDEAMHLANQLLDICREIGLHFHEGRILNTMGLIAVDKEDSSSAKKYFSASLEIANDMNNPELKSKAINSLAMVEGPLNGNYALARGYFEKSLNLAKEAGDRITELTLYGNLGFAASMQGDFEAARAYYEQSLAYSYETGHLHPLINTLINLSALAGVLKEGENALRNAQEALELAQKTSDLSGEAWAHHYMGHAHQLLGDFDLALTAYQTSIALREKLDQPALAMEPTAGLVETYLAMNDIISASQETEKILRFLKNGSTLDGTDEPIRVYHACFLLLKKKQDPLSRQVLQQANNILTAQVSNFVDDESRNRYIENIPWRRAVRDAMQENID
jgi:predicted ATPase/class 3 adenylate cyclase